MIDLSGKTRVIIQGITGKEGTYWTKQMLDAGTNIVGGITPGKGGQVLYGVPVFNSVAEAVNAVAPEATVIFVPPRFAKDAAFEAIAEGIKLVVLLGDGVPLMDAMAIKYYADSRGARVLGPNTPGCARVGEAVLGFIPTQLADTYQPGGVGVIARSGSLTNEVCSHIVGAGFGVSTFVGVGGDSVPCTRMVDCLPYFAADPRTEVLVMIGEVGGSMEQEVAFWVTQKKFTKPVVAYIAGRSAPPGKKMGHAGTIAEPGIGTIADKIRTLEEAGIPVGRIPRDVGTLLQKKLGGGKL